MEFLHPAMRHDHDIDFVPAIRLWLCNHDSKFTKWQHHAMWYMALGWHATEFARLQHPAMWHVALGLWHSIRQVAAPYNVACGSRMICHWIHPNVRHIGIPHLVSISTISLQSTCHSAPVCEILSKSDHPRQKKMTSCWWRISATLDFRGPIMGSLKSPCTTSYGLSIETIALNCLVFEKIAFFCILVIDRQTDRQTNRIDALSRSRCRERRLYNSTVCLYVCSNKSMQQNVRAYIDNKYTKNYRQMHR